VHGVLVTELLSCQFAAVSGIAEAVPSFLAVFLHYLTEGIDIFLMPLCGNLTTAV